MNCTDLEQMARDGQLRDRRREPAVVAHLRDCEGCQALYSDESPLGELLCEPSGFDFDSQHAEIEALLRAEDATWAGRLKALPSSRRHALLFIFGLVLVTLTFVTWRRADFALYSGTRMLLVISSLLVAAAFVVSEALRPLSERPSARGRFALLLTGLGLPVLFALLPQADYLHPANHGREPVWLGALPCLGIGCGVAMPVVWLWSRLDRGGEVGSRFWFLLAGLGGLFGNAVLQVHCPVTRVAHLMLGHASVGLAFGVVLVLLWRAGRLRRS